MDPDRIEYYPLTLRAIFLKLILAYGIQKMWISP